MSGWDRDRVEVEETEFGLIERDRRSGKVVGLEFWRASERLPKALLEALPRPPPRAIIAGGAGD